MKKTILFLASLLLLAGSYAQTASSFVLKDKEGNDITGTTINFSCKATVDTTVSYVLDVLNASSSTKNVKVKKVEMSMLEGVTGLSICWTSCYPPFVFESPDSEPIAPNGVFTNFIADLTYPAGLNGTCKAKFVFFDVDNLTDTSFVIVNFNIGSVGRNEILVKNAKVSNAYPNPASSMVYFDYKLPGNVNAANTKIKLCNLLGTTVSEVILTNNEGKAGINVSNLNNGVYFYSLMINNSATITRKFIVNR